ncbi:RNA polymerase subunit sigma [Streptomyces sp. NPDC004096]
MNGRHGIAPLSELLEERRYLLDLAYGLLRSASRADDAVEETYRRWYAMGDGEIPNPRAWLADTLVTHCRSRPDAPGDPEAYDAPERAERGHDIAAARDAPALGDVTKAPGAHGPGRKAALPGAEPFGAAARGAGRARDHGPRYEALGELARQSLRARAAGQVTAAQHRAVVGEFRTACQIGDEGRLAALLAPDVSAVFDGGGRIRTPDRPVGGAPHVARSLATLLAPSTGTALAEESVNGRAGLVVRCGHRVAAAITLDTRAHLIVNVWLVLNPDKLRGWNRS